MEKGAYAVKAPHPNLLFVNVLPELILFNDHRAVGRRLKRGTWDDHAQCAELRRALLEYWQQKSAKLVRWHWPVVTALANELLRCREMSGPVVERFVRQRLNAPRS